MGFFDRLTGKPPIALTGKERKQINSIKPSEPGVGIDFSNLGDHVKGFFQENGIDPAERHAKEKLEKRVAQIEANPMAARALRLNHEKNRERASDNRKKILSQSRID